jgi:methylenetetrahydrofolate reductase (NADPH)
VAANRTDDVVESGAEKLSPIKLGHEIISFLENCSIEATPHERDRVEKFPTYLDVGSTVYVAHPPKLSIDDVVDMAKRLMQVGYSPVPHIVARKIEDRKQLDSALGKLAGAGIDRLLVVAGDPAAPAGEFSDSLAVLRTGLITHHGFRQVAIAGHPESSRAIGPTVLRQALLDKCAFAARSKLDMYVVTQFGFDPDLVFAWEKHTATDNVSLPVRVGMAGRVPFRQLVRYAMRCGVGTSLKTVVGMTSAMTHLAHLPGPDELVTAFARYRAANPASRLIGAHLFAFGGLESSARWLSAVQAGRFTLNQESTGFELWPE